MSLSRASTNLHSNMPALEVQLDSASQHVLDCACLEGRVSYSHCVGHDIAHSSSC